MPPDIEFAECGELDEDMQRSLIIELNKRVGYTINNGTNGT